MGFAPEGVGANARRTTVTQLWGGRFEHAPTDAMRELSRSTQFDVAFVQQDCLVLAAHARVLHAAGLLDQVQMQSITQALPAIASDIEDGTFAITETDEDIHTSVERALAQRCGETVAAKSRAGLSRNDRVATAFRLWCIEATNAIHATLTTLIRVLAERAQEHAETIMPGYTHMQRAQPVTLGHVLAAHAHALIRDADRIQAAQARAREMPLGSGALAGSTLTLDHDLVVEALGFTSRMSNPLDAVSARDFVLETLSALAIAGVHLSRIGEEIVLWTTAEFGFAVLDDAHATGSSLMPQKKNPDVAELTRGKAGRLIGNLTGLLAACKGLPLTYNRDLQEDKEPLLDSVRTLLVVLPALSGAIEGLQFDAGRMADAAADPLLLATDLAERLVLRGVPFMQAHDAVGAAVRTSVAEGRSWLDFDDAAWKLAHPELPAAAAEGFDPVASVKKRVPGDPAAPLRAWLLQNGPRRNLAPTDA